MEKEEEKTLNQGCSLRAFFIEHENEEKIVK
jgi:hypothetical protein